MSETTHSQDDNEWMQLYARYIAMVVRNAMEDYAAHGEMELGVKHVRLKETKCVRLGAPYCEWETKW
jgi:hypothetical protein